jgi:excinuclease ABC subunit A
VTFSCPDCGGKRFVGPVLDVKHRGLDVAQLLETTIADALSLYAGDKGVLVRLAPAADVGLGYLKLGQSLNTLSGGEAQRLKLALALADTPPGALVVLDEPTGPACTRWTWIRCSRCSIGSWRGATRSSWSSTT